MGKFIQYRTLASLYDKEFSTLSAWPAAGMGDVIVTDNGKLIVIDGGGAPDAEDLLCLIEKCAGFSKPTVELWIITHPHGDHYGALRAISQNASFRERVDVKELLWWFPEDFQDQNGATNIFAGVDARMQAICDSYCDEFYKYVAPDIVFMPISKAGYRDMHGVYLTDTGAQINLALENGATTVYKAFDGNAEIEI